jgi:hypothetical protein
MSSFGIPGAFSTAVKRHFPIAFALIFGMMPLRCATLERLSLDDMIAKSTAIVRGKVAGATATFSGPVIYTHYTIQVSEQFKGASQASVEVVVPGGVANGLRQSFSGAPVLNPGDEYVLFLYTGKSGLTTVTGLTQGLFSLPANGSADPTATRSATRELMLDPANGRPVKDQTLIMRLSDLRQRIAAGVKGASAK